MTTPRTRARRKTPEAPKGIRGAPPFSLHGPVTALRVLGHGFEVTLDADRPALRIGRDPPPVADVQVPLASISRVHALLTRNGSALEVTDQGSKNGTGYHSSWGASDYVRCESFCVNAGDRFSLGSVRMLALDEPTHQLVTPLATHFGPGAHDEVDRALEAVARGHMIVLSGSHAGAALDLARTLHAHSIRKKYPFTIVDAVPRSAPAIEELCTRAGCGTIFLDLTKPFSIPLQFARNLLSDHFHLWTIAVAPTPEEVFSRLGQAFSEPKRAGFDVCTLGFLRRGWHLNMGPATFK
jgi:FHA domain